MAASEPTGPWPRGKRAAAAALCLLIFALHAGNHLLDGHGWEIFWACTFTPLLIGAAALASSARLNAVAMVWLALGNFLWIFDLLSGGAWMWTSTLTHWGGLAVAFALARRLGYPPGSWWRAHLLLLGWQQFTRLFTPPALNINVAFSIHPGSQAHFSSFPRYWLFLFVLDALIMLAGEGLFRLLLPRPAAAPGPAAGG